MNPLLTEFHLQLPILLVGTQIYIRFIVLYCFCLSLLLELQVPSAPSARSNRRFSSSICKYSG
jgi:hypothetical protein